MTLDGYSIKLLPPDLSREEFVLNFCQTLKQLEVISGEICNRINKEIEYETKNLERINDRIKSALVKVNKLKESRKATKVFSSAKYEYEYDWMNFRPQYDLSRIDHSLSHNLQEISSKIQYFDEKVIDEKKQMLKFMNMVNNIISNKLCKLVEPNVNEGCSLGKMPMNLDSISSLILFNSIDNPYDADSPSNAKDIISRRRRQGDGNQATLSLLGEAPLSLRESEKDEFWKRDRKTTLNYNPNIGNVPTLELPEFLPDLVGIADDIQYAGATVQSIAPSIPQSLLSNLPEFPTFTSQSSIQKAPKVRESPATRNTPKVQEIPAGLASITPPSNNVDKVVKTHLPPPPPLPTHLAHSEKPVDASVPETSRKNESPRETTNNNVDENDSAFAVPPPPMLPPTLIPDTPGLAAGSPHVDLMAEIRRKGGVEKADLKSTKERKIRQPIRSVEEETPGDMMGELAKRLNQRRKGISTGKLEKKSSPIIPLASANAVPQTPLDALLTKIPFKPTNVKDFGDEDFD